MTPAELGVPTRVCRNPTADLARLNILLYKHYLGEAIDVADIQVILVQDARGSDVAMRSGDQGPQNSSLPVCWIGRRSDARARQ
jgi:hypothetical protein